MEDRPKKLPNDIAEYIPIIHAVFEKGVGAMEEYLAFAQSKIETYEKGLKIDKKHEAIGFAIGLFIQKERLAIKIALENKPDAIGLYNQAKQEMLTEVDKMSAAAKALTEKLFADIGTGRSR